MSSQISSSPTPKKVAFSPVRLGPSDSQSQPGTPTKSKIALNGTPRSILKPSNSPIHNHENDVSVVLDNTTLGSPCESEKSGISVEICAQRLLHATEDD